MIDFRPTHRLRMAVAGLAAALTIAACGATPDTGAAGSGSTVAPVGSVATTDSAATDSADTDGAASGSTTTSGSSSDPRAETTVAAAQAAAGSGSTAGLAAFSDNTEPHAEADDADYTAADAMSVTLADGGSTSTASSRVSIDGDTITISAPGTYVLSGTLSNGSVVVNSSAEGKVRLVLSNAQITSTIGSALVISAADEAVVVLAPGTTNALTDGTGYDISADDAPNAALFSMADLTIAGTGTLTVTGNTNDGIGSKDGVVILSGSITVQASDDGIRGKDYVIVDGGTVNVTAGGDALKSDNETDDTVGYLAINGGAVTLKAGDDGMHAEGDLAVTGGTLAVVQSNEGLEGVTITLAGGSTDITASDDGVNASSGTGTNTGGGPGGGGMQGDGSLLTISGGTHLVNAGGDGLDSNGSTVISGGTTVVSGPTGSGNGALDSNGGITVTGGTVLAAGSAGMAESPSAESSSGWIAASVEVAAGQTVSVVSGSTVIASYTAVKDVSSLVLADSALKSGESYDLYVGGQLAATTVGTYSAGGSIDGATKTTTVTAGQAVAGGMGPGGMGRRPRG